MQILKYHIPKIITRNKSNQINGFLIPIYNELDSPLNPEQRPKQVYMTVVAPGMIKGPHLHKKRWGLFTCIRGNIKIVIKTPAGYEEYFSGENHQYQTIQVPAGCAAALHNDGKTEAFVLNMPSPAWSPEDPDDHPVSFGDYTG